MPTDIYRTIEDRTQALKRGATRHSNGFYPLHINGLEVEWEIWSPPVIPPQRELTDTQLLDELANQLNVKRR